MNWEQEYIMETYKLPFLEKGLLIKCGQNTGKITGFKNGKVKVRLESGEKGLYHPTWEMIYLDEKNNVLADFTTGDKNNG